jgi:hypothetical protein
MLQGDPAGPPAVLTKNYTLADNGKTFVFDAWTKGRIAM